MQIQFSYLYPMCIYYRSLTCIAINDVDLVLKVTWLFLVKQHRLNISSRNADTALIFIPQARQRCGVIYCVMWPLVAGWLWNTPFIYLATSYSGPSSTGSAMIDFIIVMWEIFSSLIFLISIAQLAWSVLWHILQDSRKWIQSNCVCWWE